MEMQQKSERKHLESNVIPIGKKEIRVYFAAINRAFGSSNQKEIKLVSKGSNLISKTLEIACVINKSKGIEIMNNEARILFKELINFKNKKIFVPEIEILLRRKENGKQ